MVRLRHNRAHISRMTLVHLSQGFDFLYAAKTVITRADAIGECDVLDHLRGPGRGRRHRHRGAAFAASALPPPYLTKRSTHACSCSDVELVGAGVPMKPNLSY